MKNSWLTQVLVVIYCSFVANLYAYPPLEKSEFEAIGNVAEKIASSCPKNNCMIIGIGRSPTPIMAYLQAYDRAKTVNVPLSDFKYTDLTAKEEAELGSHFNVFFDQKELLEKKIIILDYSQNGDSIIAAAFYLGKYFATKYKTNLEIQMYALAFKNRVTIVENNIENFIKKASKPENLNYHISYTYKVITGEHDNELIKSLLSQRYDDVSEYGSFYLREKIKKEKISSKEYLYLKEAMGEMPQLIRASEQELRDKLANSKNPEIVASAFKRLIDDTKSTSGKLYGLVAGLASEMSSVRSFATKTLQGMNVLDEETLGSLARLLKQGSKDTQEAAFEVLNTLKPQDYETLKLLVSILEQGSPPVQMHVYKLLKSIKPHNQEVSTLLRKLVEEKSSDNLAFGIGALMYLAPNDKSIHQLIRKLLLDPSSKVRHETLAGLKKAKGSANEAGALSLINMAFRDEDPEIRKLAIEASASFHPVGDTQQVFNSIVRALALLLDDPLESDDIKLSALKTLKPIVLIGFVPESKKIYKTMSYIMESSNKDLRDSAFAVLLNFKPESADENSFVKSLLRPFMSFNSSTRADAQRAIDFFAKVYPSIRKIIVAELRTIKYQMSSEILADIDKLLGRWF